MSVTLIARPLAILAVLGSVAGCGALDDVQDRVAAAADLGGVQAAAKAVGTKGDACVIIQISGRIDNRTIIVRRFKDPEVSACTPAASSGEPGP